MNGFTLIEALIVFSIVAILSAISLPPLYSLKVNNDLELAEITIAQTLRRAQTLSRAVANDEIWGAYVEDGALTLFNGQSFLGRDTGFDEISDLPATLTLSGLQEVTFTKLEGMPQTTGTIIITSSRNETRTITINQKGRVDY